MSDQAPLDAEQLPTLPCDPDNSFELDKSGTSTESETGAQGPRGNGTLSKDESEQRQIEILKTVVQHNNGQIFEWGHKAKVLEQCLEPLNQLPIFNGTLKINTLKDRWRKAEKTAEDIMANPEKFVKLTENGGKDMSELEKLYFQVAQRLKLHKDAKENEKAQSEANTTDAQHRLTAAMQSVARRCGYSDISQAEKLLAEEEAEDNEAEHGKQYISESPKPEDVAGKKRSPSAMSTGESKDKGGSFGRGTSQGHSKRAKGNPALNLDRESSQDPLASIAQGGDRLMTFLETQAQSEKGMMEELAKSQKIAAEAERLKQAAAATEAFIKAQQSGVELPPGLMAMFNATD